MNEFWKDREMTSFSREEWESLCDGCGRCCLHKLEDEETRELRFTAVACFELNLETCRCRHYETRQQRVPDCLVLSPAMDTRVFSWLPPTCAYRLISEGKNLYAWHPLRSGRQDSVEKAGISVGDFAVSELHVDEEDFEDYWIELGSGEPE
ncbi:MAG: YcgN family cysteine cluster protein [bacterium]